MDEGKLKELMDDVEESHASTGNLMESKTSHLDDLLTHKLEEAFHKQTSSIRLHEVAKIASEHSPIDLAYAVSRLPQSARPVVYENLPDSNAKMLFLINTDRATRLSVFRLLDDDEIAGVINKMPTDEAVWVLDDMPERRFRRVLDLLSSEKKKKINALQKHGRNTAGRLMTNEFFAFTMDVKIGQAAAHIRDNPGIDLTRRIFVLSQAGELQGFVPGRNLIVNPPHLPLRQVMQPIVHKVVPESTREEVVDIVERYKVPALPVVDSENYLLGVITYEDVVELIEDIADETITRMAGTTEDIGSHESVIKRALSRAPWLFVTVSGGFISAASISYFGHLIGPLFAFAVCFIPLITGISGSVGVQCSTVLVRSMAIGVLSSGGKREAIWKELAIGALIGLFFGAFCGGLVAILNEYGIYTLGTSPLAVAFIVSTGLVAACITAALLGVFAPLFFARIRVDPAVSSGPIVTAFSDVLSMLMYLLIARVMSSFFFAG